MGPYIGGSRQKVRKLLASVTISTLRDLLKFMRTSEKLWNEIAKIITNIMERLRNDKERNRNLKT